jgi:hypothetical protein
LFDGKKFYFLIIFNYFFLFYFFLFLFIFYLFFYFLFLKGSYPGTFLGRFNNKESSQIANMPFANNSLVDDLRVFKQMYFGKLSGTKEEQEVRKIKNSKFKIKKSKNLKNLKN